MVISSNRAPGGEEASAGSTHSQSGGFGLRDKEIASLKMITNAERAGGDTQQTELRMVRGIRETFEADTAMLILFDEENRDLVIKKTLDENGEWGQQISQRIEPGLVMEAIQSGEHICLADISGSGDYNPVMDGAMGIETHSYLCSPLISNGIQFGALVLINPMKSMLTEDRIDLIQILTGALANALYNARLFTQLKVSTADLEASRYELLNSRNTLRALFDHLPSSIYIVDRFYTIIAINMSRSNRLGEKPSHLVGRKCYEKLYGRTSPCAECRVHETLADGRITNRFAREVLNSEDNIEWEVSTFPIYNSDSEPAQAIITEYDVTEKRLLEADLIQSEKMAAIGQLAAGVAHEIYNPLTAIIANTQMIRRMLPTVDEDLYESLELVEHAGIRASQVIRTLLNAARKDEYENAAMDLNMTIENSLSLLSHEIVRRPITIQKDLQADLPPIHSNQNHLQGVWINLIMNAIDAMEGKGGQITITSRYKDNQFIVSVADSGKGIPKNKLNRIFEPYFTTKSPGQGTGLGLSVCMRVVKQHGGTIHVESQPEKGTKFIVILPDQHEPEIHSSD